MSTVEFKSAKLKLLAILNEMAFEANVILLEACSLALINLEKEEKDGTEKTTN